MFDFTAVWAVYYLRGCDIYLYMYYLWCCIPVLFVTATGEVLSDFRRTTLLSGRDNLLVSEPQVYDVRSVCFVFFFVILFFEVTFWDLGPGGGGTPPSYRL